MGMAKDGVKNVIKFIITDDQTSRGLQLQFAIRTLMVPALSARVQVAARCEMIR